MATRILLVSLFIFLLAACDKKEDDINPGKDYTGSLTLTYSRSFPTFQSGIDIPVTIFANGVVTFAVPDQVNYTGESQKIIDGSRTRVREQGTITVTSLTGEWIKVDGKETVKVNLSCLLEGDQIVWTYDDYEWVMVSQMPYTLENPVESPMLFRVDNAVKSSAVCGAGCSDCWGNSCFRWILILSPSI